MQRLLDSGTGNGCGEVDKSLSPPYVPFLTFMNCLEWLGKEGIPLRLDRSFWEKKDSGSTGVQLMAGLRFLRLLKDEVPQGNLERLVESKGDERRDILADLIRQAYDAVDFEALAKATPRMLSDWFSTYRLKGDTQRKAESFFVNACKATDISLSNALRRKARNKQPRTTTAAVNGKKANKGRLPVISAPEAEARSKDEPDDVGRVQQNRISLASGGEITLAISVDLFSLSKEDRDFVLELVDKMKGYVNQSHT